MKRNLGFSDRLLRGLLGWVLVLVGIYFYPVVGYLAVIPLATALVGICPAYSLAGFNTCEKGHGGDAH